MDSSLTSLEGESQKSPTGRTLLACDERNNPQDCHGAFDRIDCSSQKWSACRGDEGPPKRIEFSLKATTSYEPSLLGIPVEIRQDIYRHLLLDPRPIGWATGCRDGDDDFGWAWPHRRFGTLHLSVDILRVCRQTSTEAIPILYAENTFAFKVYVKGYGLLAPFFFNNKRLSNHIAESKKYGVLVEKMERFVIKVEVQDSYEECFGSARSSLLRACEVLSENPRLRQLDIFLEDDYEDVTKSVVRVLEPLTILRGIEAVKFVGVPPVYARYLRTVMTKGPETLKKLPKRYFKMQQRVGWQPISHVERMMRKAMEHMERGHPQMFDRYHWSLNNFFERWCSVRSETTSEESEKTIDMEEINSNQVKIWLGKIEGRVIGTSESDWNPGKEEEEGEGGFSDRRSMSIDQVRR